jgi:hypothetical protein
MKIFINVGTDRRVKGYGSTRGNASEVEMNVADDHDFFKNPFIYKVVFGTLIKDEAYQKEQVEQKEEVKNAPTEIEILQTENTELKLALAEMAESIEIGKMENQLALAELAEMITGGA